MAPLTLAFNLPFHEAIAAAVARGTVLPDVYYGQLQGLARQQAFSIAGIASLDQLQAVKNSLDEFMRSGGSFNAWKKKAAVLDLNLPAHRLDNIWRTNLQGNYLRGHWEQFVRNAESRPYLMYDAINDSRVRRSHLAHDGVIRKIDDAFWRTHSPPLGYRCRCNLISLTEEQAMARSRPNPDGQGSGIYKTPQLEGGIPAEPDKGWDYNPFEDRLAPLRKALERFDPKLREVGESIIQQAEALAETPRFVAAKTVKEAEKWMVQNDVVDVCDFGKITDVALVNEWNQSIFDHVREFPELRKNQKFTGSIQAQQRRWRNIQVENTAQWLKTHYQHLTDKEVIERARKAVKAIRTDNRWAQSWSQKDVFGVAINEKWGTEPSKLADSLKRSLVSGFHPKACDTVKSIADHEMGHQLDKLLDISKDAELITLWKSIADIEVKVSGYAKENIVEFIAEAWAEYRNNPTPRPAAQKVGDIIRKRYADRFATN